MLIAALVLGIIIAALPHVVWLLAWAVGKGFHYTLPYAPFGWTALALVVVVWAVLAWGRYDEGGQTLNVNAGLGCTLPVRVNCPAEITLITLHKQ